MDVINYILSKKLKKYVDDSVGNVPDEKITEAVNTYLDENPVAPGATSEQAEQIQNNTNKISELEDDLSQQTINAEKGYWYADKWRNGYFNTGTMKFYTGNYDLRLSQPIDLQNGDIVSINTGTNSVNIQLFKKNSDTGDYNIDYTYNRQLEFHFTGEYTYECNEDFTMFVTEVGVNEDCIIKVTNGWVNRELDKINSRIITSEKSISDNTDNIIALYDNGLFDEEGLTETKKVIQELYIFPEYMGKHDSIYLANFCKNYYYNGFNRDQIVLRWEDNGESTVACNIGDRMLYNGVNPLDGIGYIYLNWDEKKDGVRYDRVNINKNIVSDTSYCPHIKSYLDELNGMVDYHNALKIQNNLYSDSENMSFIPSDKLIINPDNIVARLSSEPTYVSDSVNPNTALCMHYRWIWNDVESENGEYDFSKIESLLKTAYDNNTRVCIRIMDWSDYNQCKYLTKPSDYTLNKAEYDEWLSIQTALWGFDEYEFSSYDGTEDVLLFKKNGVENPIYIGYPNKYFWQMVIESDSEKLILSFKEKYYTSIDMFSNTYKNAITNLNTSFYSWLSLELEGTDIKRKYVIENLQVGWGRYSEGLPVFWGYDYNKVPEWLDLDILKDYVSLFTSIYKDIPISVPFVFNSIKTNQFEDAFKILDVSNDCGNIGLFFDAIGSEYTRFSSILVKMNGKRICGEGAGESVDYNFRNAIFYVIKFHLSGSSIHNFTKQSTPSRMFYHELKKYMQMLGSRIYISNAVLSDGKISFNIQNLGITKIFSPYWEMHILCKDSYENEISDIIVDYDIRSLEPNGKTYETYGLLSEGTEISNVSVPDATHHVYIKISDKYGIYKPYYLANYGRKDDGSYLLI